MGGAFFFLFIKSLLLLTFIVEFLAESYADYRTEFPDRTDDCAPESARDLGLDDPLAFSTSSMKSLVVLSGCTMLCVPIPNLAVV